ncbi:MAG TPA: hypothetical protein VG318_07940 [Actinomycetota bacterium]|nr:hypothetical protein [Actinomycetota bacterium]
MDTPSSPDALTQAWRALVESIKSGDSALGERLFLLGAGPVPVTGAAGGALTLTSDGGVVLVVGLAEAPASAAAEIARQLDGIERLAGTKLREAGVDPASGGGLTQRHAAFFGLSDPVAELNTSQRCIVVLPEGADDTATEALRTELGDRLAGVFAAGAAGVTALGGAVAEAPEAEIVLEPEAEEPGAEPEPEAMQPEAEAEPEVEAEPEIEAPEAEPDVEVEAEAEAPEAEAEAEAEAPEAEPEPEEDVTDAGAEGPAAIEAALDGAPAPETDEATAEDDTAATVIVETATGQPVEVFDAYLSDESATVITEESDHVERTGVAAWPIGNWIGLSMVVLGIVLAVIGVMSLRDSDTAEDTEPAGEVNPLIRTVATNVPPDATHGRWIGQQRAVTLSDGTLVFVYPTEDALNVVKDETNGGESWGEPFSFTEVQPVSLSVDVDSKDRLHIAYSDGASVNYVRLKNKPTAWKPSRVIRLDDGTTSLNVDVAWDEQNQTAHVVWVQQSDEGEAPAWAALTNEDGIHRSAEGILADPGMDVPVLANVAADGRSSLLVTFRRGDQTTGWTTRYSEGRAEDGTWPFHEEEVVPLDAFVGAADVVYDRQKTAHLVLRDSTNFALTYFTKRQNEGWTQPEVAHEGTEVTAVEFPALSTNAGDGYVYLFFQTDEFWPAGEVAYVVRTEEGWSEPFDIVSDADAPEGAQYPVAPDRVDEQALVFWTKTAETYEVDTTPVQAP